MAPRPPLPVIVNASAGAQSDTAAKISAACAQNGVAAQILPASSGAELQALATNALAANPARLVVAGGDGSVSAVAMQVVGTSTALGVLPTGTLNHFAKDAGIPLDLDAAVATAVRGRVLRVDIGSVNGVCFVNNSSLGLYPRLVRLREREQQRMGRSKWAALAWAALAMFRRYSHIAVTLAVDGERVSRRTPLVFVGNNAYEITGLEIGSRRTLEGGRLCVYLPRVPGRMGLLLLALRAFLRSPSARQDLELISTERMTITAHQAQVLVSVDGEVRGMTSPLAYAVHPRALAIVVPHADSNGERAP